MTKKISVQEIKTAMNAKSSHWWSRETMKFFGDTMASFATILSSDGQTTILYRKPGASINVFGDMRRVTREMGFNAWTFNAETGEIDRIEDEKSLDIIWEKI